MEFIFAIKSFAAGRLKAHSCSFVQHVPGKVDAQLYEQVYCQLGHKSPNKHKLSIKQSWPKGTEFSFTSLFVVQSNVMLIWLIILS